MTPDEAYAALYLRWHLYAMMVPAPDNIAYFKIGITTNLDARPYGVQTGCPLEIKEMLHVFVGEQGKAREVEKAMHLALKGYGTFGEWFRFDLADAEHKAAFHAAARSVLTPALGDGWKWEHRVLNLSRLMRQREMQALAVQARRDARVARNLEIAALALERL